MSAGEVDGDHVAVVRRGGLGAGGPQGPVVGVERRAGHRGVGGLRDRVGADAGLELAEQHRCRGRCRRRSRRARPSRRGSPVGVAARLDGVSVAARSGWSTRSAGRRTPTRSTRSSRRVSGRRRCQLGDHGDREDHGSRAGDGASDGVEPVACSCSWWSRGLLAGCGNGSPSGPHRARRCRRCRRSAPTAGRRTSGPGGGRQLMSGCLQVVARAGLAQRGGPAGGVALDRTPADAERLGDLGLGQVDVVAQRRAPRAAGAAARASASSTVSRRWPPGRPRRRRGRRTARGCRSAWARTTLRWRSAGARAVDDGPPQVGERPVGVAERAPLGVHARRRRPGRPPRPCRGRGPAGR